MNAVSDDDGKLYISMTRYCYCTHEDDDNLCYFPGPTLEMHSLHQSMLQL